MESPLTTLQTCDGTSDCKIGNDYNADRKLCNYYYGYIRSTRQHTKMLYSKPKTLLVQIHWPATAHCHFSRGVPAALVGTIMG